jgi:hypothetical protein
MNLAKHTTSHHMDKIKKQNHEPGIVVHACKPSTWEAEAGGSGLHGKSLSQK